MSYQSKINYPEINQNKFKTFLLLLLLPASLMLMLGLVFYVTGAQDMLQIIAGYVIPIGIGALIWMLISMAFGSSIALNSARAQQISEKSNPEIYNLVRGVATKAGLPVPKIYIINDNNLNAFATGSNPHTASIALTKGIIQRLNREELEGVIAHELSHIGNRDTLIMVVVAIGISVFTMVGQMIMFNRMLSGRRSNNSGGNVVMLIGVVFLIFGYLVAPIIQLAISRRREYMADASAARITGNPMALANALAKIAPNSKVAVLGEQDSLNAMCIANPSSKQPSLYLSLSGLYATHPPIEKRIEALKKLANPNLDPRIR
ncbi:MAG: M48 family metallopeptidase [Spirochaetaceae bacterium]|nr:M48 family metallopeptidase [Spirochaetaceae bacterium]